MHSLAKQGILTGVALMPVLPFIEDSLENVLSIARLARDHGASYILPWMGMTLRDGSRQYFYARLDKLFPGLRQRYESQFGQRYTCNSPRASQLYRSFQEECDRLGLAQRMPVFTPQAVQRQKQMRLF
jgi:DNA repair photolyase